MHDLTIHDLADLTRGRLTFSNMPPLGGDCEPIERIVVDSRHVHPGDVFWCLPGKRRHGDMFLEEAFMRGALGVVGANRPVQPWPGTFVIHVADSLAAFYQLARTVRRRFSGNVIAVGESRNSTATVSLIDQVLASSFAGSVFYNVGTDISDIPISILNWSGPSRYVVAEVASSDPD